MATTYSAKQVAREVAKRLNRDYDAKRVRAWVRENIPAYDDDGYTAHAYDHATFTRIVNALVARGREPRPAAASKGRAGKAKVAKATTPKAPPTRAMGSGPVPTAAQGQTSPAGAARVTVTAPRPTGSVPSGANSAPIKSTPASK